MDKMNNLYINTSKMGEKEKNRKDFHSERGGESIKNTKKDLDAVLQINSKDMKEKSNTKNTINNNLFDAYDKHARKSWLKASLDNGLIDEKEYLNEIKKLPIEEKSISDFNGEMRNEYMNLEKYAINSEKIASAIELIIELFKWKTSKLNWRPASDHSIGVAAILAKYNVQEQIIIVWLLHDVIEDIENWEEKLREKWCSEEIISLVKELSENKLLSWKERKQQYLNHLKTASNDIKTISAADKLYNVRSFLDDYLIEQDKMRDKFNAGKEDQIKLLKDYMEALKYNYSHPIADELEEVIKRFLRMVS